MLSLERLAFDLSKREHASIEGQLEIHPFGKAF